MNLRARVSASEPQAINRALETNLRQVVRRSTPVRTTVGTTEFVVTHDLGDVPKDFHASARGNVVVYATEANRDKWTATQLVLTASASSEADISAETW